MQEVLNRSPRCACFPIVPRCSACMSAFLFIYFVYNRVCVCVNFLFLTISLCCLINFRVRCVVCSSIGSPPPPAERVTGVVVLECSATWCLTTSGAITRQFTGRTMDRFFTGGCVYFHLTGRTVYRYLQRWTCRWFKTNVWRVSLRGHAVTHPSRNKRSTARAGALCRTLAPPGCTGEVPPQASKWTPPGNNSAATGPL